MKSFILVLAYFIVLAAVQTTAIIDLLPDVTDGKQAPTFPFMVSISDSSSNSTMMDPKQRKAQPEKTKINTHHCGGVLLTNRWVLSSAHCFVKPDGTITSASSISAGVGSNDLVEIYDRGRIQASRLLLLPGYDIKQYYHDFALIQLSIPVNKSVFKNTPYTFGCLYRQTTNHIPAILNNPLLAIGWGNTVPFIMNNATGTWGPVQYSRYLRQVDVNDASYLAATCHNRPDKICTFGVLPNRGPCRGDSGSPLLMNDDVIAGLMMPGTGQSVSQNETKYCHGDGPYSRVSVALEWILDNVNDDVCVVEFE